MRHHPEAHPSQPRSLVLASASPRRRELLARVGVPARVVASGVDELTGGDTPAMIGLKNARLKAEDTSSRVPAGALVLAADTIVVIDGEVLGKPASPDDASDMLRRLSGRTHQVMTAFVVLEAPDGQRIERVVTTDVEFKPLTEAEIEGYVASGEPFDKAGGYGIQGIGAFLVTRVNGSYTNVVGLPLAEVLEAIASLGGPRPFAQPTESTP